MSRRRSYRRKSDRKSSRKLSRKSSRKKSNRRSSNKITLRKGTLRQFGYSTDKSKTDRRKAINKAMKKDGELSVFRKLNALYVLTRNTNPRVSKIFYKDRNYVKRNF